MSITLEQGTPDSLDEVVEAVAAWQQDGMPVQLHPGDLGWNWSLGAPELARSVRVWRGDGQILAVGMVDDDSGLIRMALAPSVDGDDGFADHVLADLSDPARGVLPDDKGAVEARYGAVFRGLLHRSGWVADEPWTPLLRDLTSPVPDSGLRIEVVDPRCVEDRTAADPTAEDRTLLDRVAVQRAAFPTSTFTLERWRTMAGGSPYRRARCLVAYDRGDAAVATVTVWSAGPGRPGLIEPLGVHRDHRGQGHGKAITVAAAAALQETGSSSAAVCTPSSNAGGVALYVSAGFRRLPDVTDLRRPS